MDNLRKYNQISRFWGRNSVRAARKVTTSDGKSQKQSTCGKLNDLLTTNRHDGIQIIKHLVNFKQQRNDSWFGAGNEAQNNSLQRIENILNTLGDNNKYPTLTELELLVKNSSYFVQRDIPRHFKEFLVKLDDEVKENITDENNRAFLQDNGIIDKINSNKSKAGGYSNLPVEGMLDTNKNQEPQKKKQKQVFTTNGEVKYIVDDSIYLESAPHYIEGIITPCIAQALFEVNKSDDPTFEPISFTLNQDSFNAIKKQYISLIDRTDSQQKKEYIDYLEGFEYKLTELSTVTIFPAYSKEKKSCFHNRSGDAALKINLANGNSTSFVFDAPSELRGMDWSLLRSFGDGGLFPSDALLAMHAKLLFILHHCSQSDFINDKKLAEKRKALPYKLLSLPYSWVTTTADSYKIMVSGDCNAVIQYGNLNMLISAGYIHDQLSYSCFKDKFNGFYESIDHQIKTKEQLNNIKEISDAYQQAEKDFSDPCGGIEMPITVAKSIDNIPINISLFTDGLTDNLELFKYILESIQKQKPIKQQMEYICGYMNELSKEKYKVKQKIDDAVFLPA